MVDLDEAEAEEARGGTAEEDEGVANPRDNAREKAEDRV